MKFIATASILLALTLLHVCSAHGSHGTTQEEQDAKEAHISDLIARFPGHVHPRADDNYTPKGRQYFVPELNLTVYDTALTDQDAPARTLISVYDIFGFHNHLFYIADTVAAGKGGAGPFRVIVPDFFREGPVGSWENGVDEDVRKVIAHFTRSSNNTFGIYGFCWGGRISVKAAQELPEIRGAGLVHPSGVVTEDANTVRGSVLLLPARDDPDMDEFERIVADRLGLDAVFHRRFTDVDHGFAGAGGDWGVPLINLRVDQVVDYLITFMDRHLRR